MARCCGKAFCAAERVKLRSRATAGKATRSLTFWGGICDLASHTHAMLPSDRAPAQLLHSLTDSRVCVLHAGIESIGVPETKGRGTWKTPATSR